VLLAQAILIETKIKKNKDSLSLINSMLNNEIKKIGIKNIKKNNGNLG
jgi:hypothetical protein